MHDGCAQAAQQCVRTDLIPVGASSQSAYEEELGSDASQPQLLHDAIATDFSFLAKVQLISERATPKLLHPSGVVCFTDALQADVICRHWLQAAYCFFGDLRSSQQERCCWIL
ncbi:LDHB [Symbiodinium sp. CCMP2592]|nr:LDHB [Symbiodinium sp. CCMP2592]